MDITYIIPAYNRKWCLEKAISSCKMTNLKYEIIVIDDGSTDGTNEWLKTRQDIILISQPNQGKDWAVNKGFKNAIGRYIRFLDSDDWLLPFSTDKLFNHAEQFNFDIVCAGYEVYSENEDFLYENKWIVCDDFLAQQLGECDSSHYSAYLFKKEFIINIPHRQEFGARDDRQFIIEAALKNPIIGYIKEPTLAHRFHSNLKLQTFDNFESCYHNLALLLIYKRAFKILSNENRLSSRYKKAGIKVLWPLAHWVAKSHIKEAVEIVNWIYDLDPNFEIPEKGILKFMYKYLGFNRTEKILSIRRAIKY